MSRALVLAAHGSRRDPAANGLVRRLAEAVRARRLFDEVAVAFHQGEPRFETVLDEITADEVTVVPLLTSAGHYADVVLPEALVRNRRFTELRLRQTPPVGTHSGIASLVARRVTGLLRHEEIPRHLASLAIVGHGTPRHQESRTSAMQLADTLRRRRVAGEVLAAFLDDDPPLDALLQTAALPHLIVVPFLIGGGTHVSEDIPQLLGLRDWRLATGDSRRSVTVDQAIGSYPGLIEIIIDLARRHAPPPPPRFRPRPVRSRREPGTVHLVGAGPGDPGLITVRGLDLLRRADVVVHDRLIGSELLGEVRSEALLVDVGKGPGHAPYSQAQINALLVEHARQGRTVVRLKGGDPFVFGRGSEEAKACNEAGVRVQVVPGISSAIAGPAAAGIPVTARGVSQSFTVLTGHGADGGGLPVLPDFPALPGHTLVLLMGRAHLGQIAAQLIAAGRDPSTPAACIQSATTPEQRVTRATLATITEAVERDGLQAPVVTVIGEVAALAVGGTAGQRDSGTAGQYVGVNSGYRGIAHMASPALAAPLTRLPAVPPTERLSLVVVGHVDHGKSTIIGRLLADTGSLPEGKLEQIRELCARTARPFEYAFLLDALKDERAQGITIDSARAFFTSARRTYVIIDAPGHIEFLKNMVSGAARAEAAFLVIDAREGIQENSRRHGYLMGMLGIRQVAVLINKMDLVGHDEQTYQALVREFAGFLAQAGVTPAGFIPVSGANGDNLTRRSTVMDWYCGPTALEMLDGFRTEPAAFEKPFRMPVQDVYKFTAQGDDRRIIAGTIESGRVSVGDTVVFHPSGKRSRVRTIETFNQPAPRHAGAGSATGFTLEEQIYVSRGQIAVREGEPAPKAATRIAVSLFWLGKEPLVTGRDYVLKLGSARVRARLESVERVIDASDLQLTEHKPRVDRHDVADCVLRLETPVAVDLVDQLAGTSRFVLLDDYEISGGGIVRAVLAVGPQGIAGTAGAQADSGAVVWLTGLSGAGKSTIAERVCAELRERGLRVEHLDGDGVREVFPTGFTREHRDEHNRRIAFLASRLEHHGVVVVASFVSPYRESRAYARSIARRFVEVHVATSLEECERRDVKGLYARARRRELSQFTGIDDPYEPPVDPELTIDTRDVSVEEASRQILDMLSDVMPTPSSARGREP